MEGSDVTTFVGNVVGEFVTIQGITVLGDLYSQGRCAIFIDNVVHGSVGIAVVGECDVGLGVVAFNTVDGPINIAGSSLVWNNTTSILGKGGRTAYFEALNNTISEGGINIRGGGLIKGNLILNAAVGIRAVSGTIGLSADIIGNRILDPGTGLLVGGSVGGHVNVLGNQIIGIHEVGIDYQFSVPPILADNLIAAAPPQAGAPTDQAVVRLSSYGAALRGNTITGGSAGVRIVLPADGSAADRVVELDSNIIGPTAGPGVEIIGGGTVVATRNDVHGNTPDWQGLDNPEGLDGNISLDPVFHNPSDEDWSIDPASPCVDSGSRTSAALDLAGRPRVVDGDMNGLADQDIGAYEAVPEVLDLLARTGPLRIEWSPNPHAVSGFDVYSGRLSALAGSGLSALATEACSYGGTSYSIEGPSQPGDGTIYLAVPRALVNGSAGLDSEGHPRVLPVLCP